MNGISFLLGGIYMFCVIYMTNYCIDNGLLEGAIPTPVMVVVIAATAPIVAPILILKEILCD